MFKARGTRIIFENDATTVSARPLVFTPAHVPDHAPEPLKQPEKPVSDVSGNFGVSPAMLALPEQIAKNADDAADLAAMLGMGFPTLPPNFRDQLLAAKAGNIDAIVLMRRIGEQVPEHLQMGFMEMVHDMMADD